MAEVVNLLGSDVASNGSMDLTNADSSKNLTVESTEAGYLSVGTAGSEGSIGIETADGTFSAGNAGKEGAIGLENRDGALSSSLDKEGTISLETEDGILTAGNGGKEGSIALETEGENLSLETGDKEGSIALEAEDGTLLSASQEEGMLTTGSSGTAQNGSYDSSDSRSLAADKGSSSSRVGTFIAENVQQEDEDKDKKEDEDEEKKDSEKREGEANITYSDVA